MDYNKTFAHVVKLSSIRAFLAIVVVKDLKVHQLDFKSAIFNNDLEDIFMLELKDKIFKRKDKWACM